MPLIDARLDPTLPANDRVGCPACGLETGKRVGEKNGYSLARCTRCGTLFVVELPPASAADVYEDYYDGAARTPPAFLTKRFDELVGAFARSRQTNRFLDVGCGAGMLLQAARRAGWNACGLEVSLPAVEHVRSMGFEVVHGELRQAPFEPGTFDVVTIVEVLEHVPDPVELLRSAATLLRPGGLLWATTPHGRGLSGRALSLDWSVVSPPEHLQLFSVEGLRAAVAAAGFSGAKVMTHGVNPHELLTAAGRHLAGREERVTVHRNESGYRLNEALSGSALRRSAKRAVNSLLNLSRMGDSLKLTAIK
jgi:SAM-dependent methyltransferase